MVFIFGWLRRRRRAKLLAAQIPSDWSAILTRDLELWSRLGDDERAHLLDITRVLVAEKNWEGAGGLELDEEMIVVIAAQAAVLLLGIEHDYYKNVKSIVVYPAGYRIPGGPDEAGVVAESRDVLGTAHHRGPVVLSWVDARRGGRDADDAKNLVFHEFAHKLDMLDGVIDGTPPLADQATYHTWYDVMTREFERLQLAADRRRRTLLDKYGATNVAEFFAVATTTFFEKPHKLRARHPELYEVMKAFYKQDPASWRRQHHRERRRKATRRRLRERD